MKGYIKLGLSLVFCMVVLELESSSYLKYYRLINQAEWLAYNNNDAAAIGLYLEALTAFESKVDYYHYEDAINLLIKHKRYSKAVFLMRKAVRMFGYVHEGNLKIQNWKDKKWLKHYAVFSRNYDRDKRLWKSDLDINAIRLYAYIMATDQYPRTLLRYVRLSSYNIDSLNVEEIQYVMREKTDSINKQIFMDHCLQFGYPGLFVSGGMNNWYSFFAHTLSSKYDSSFFSYFNPILKQKVILGDLSPFVYATVMDYRNPSEGYSVMTYVDSSGSRQFVVNKEIDMSKIDERRSAIGLPTLYQQARILGISQLPEGYVVPKEFSVETH